jgi:hypothetical protein
MSSRALLIVGMPTRLRDLLIRRSVKPLPAEEDKPEDQGLAALTREERAVLRQMLEEGG